MIRIGAYGVFHEWHPNPDPRGVPMTRFTRATIGLTAAGLAIAGAAVAPKFSSAAPARATTHTLRLAAHQTANHNFPPNKFAGAETDRNPATGAVVGYDTIRGSFNFTTHVVTIDAAVALRGGLITAHLKGKGQTFDGVITGGTGKYQTIKGTIHAQSKSGSKVTHITFTYTL
jgi:hypothetical protein